MYLCLAGWSDTSLLDHDYCKKIDSEDIPLIDLSGEEPSSESAPNLGPNVTRKICINLCYHITQYILSKNLL